MNEAQESRSSGEIPVRWGEDGPIVGVVVGFDELTGSINMAFTDEEKFAELQGKGTRGLTLIIHPMED